MNEAVSVSLIGGGFSVVAAIAALIAVRLDRSNKQAIDHVHGLVDTKLTEALAKIEELEKLLAERVDGKLTDALAKIRDLEKLLSA